MNQEERDIWEDLWNDERTPFFFVISITGRNAPNIGKGEYDDKFVINLYAKIFSSMDIRRLNVVKEILEIIT
jgi:hypothetical protein